MIDVLSLGELLVDFVALQSGKKISQGPDFQPAPGGAPANVAAGVSRLGKKSAFVGTVGHDSFGRFLKAALDSEGVDTRWVRADLAVNTTLAFVSLDADGERDFEFFRSPGADTQLTKADIESIPWTDVQIFHFGSVSLSQEPSRTATKYAAEIAFQQGILCSFDPNFRPPLWPSWEEALPIIRDLLQWVNILKVNEEEFQLLVPGRSYRDGADELFAQYPELRLQLVTVGSRGVEAFTREGSLHVPAFAAAVKDTTGAGDGFLAGFLVSIIEQGAAAGRGDMTAEQLQQALRQGNAAAAITTEGAGAIPSLPYPKDIQKLLNS